MAQVWGRQWSYSRANTGKVDTPHLQAHVSPQGRRAWWRGTTAWSRRPARAEAPPPDPNSTTPAVDLWGRTWGIHPSGRAPTPSRDDRGRANAQGPEPAVLTQRIRRQAESTRQAPDLTLTFLALTQAVPSYALGHLRAQVVHLGHSQALAMPWASYELELCTSATYELELCTLVAHKPELRLGQVTSPSYAPRLLTSPSCAPRLLTSPSYALGNLRVQVMHLGHLQDRVVHLDRSQAPTMPCATYKLELCTSATYEPKLRTSAAHKPELRLGQLMSPSYAP
ncbi:hypothetical protein BHE74_00047878 [Ensete ventricosum]|nr:hypothetical protein BHE74_00047878 [Ensete ventricosum]RZS18649.1 hypothetical protein BHM03_00050961 [Ensete ventricosum]